MKRFILSVIMTASAVIGINAWGYQGQCVSMHQSTGDSLLLDLEYFYTFGPRVDDGKIVWDLTFGTYDGMRTYTEEDITSIEFQTEKEVTNIVRKALTEFYEATNGDQWANNKNWCSDEPIGEWFGIVNDTGNGPTPYPQYLRLDGNQLSGHLPGGDTMQRLVGVRGLNLWSNEIGGELPKSMERMYSLEGVLMDNNQLTGEIPQKMTELPFFYRFEVGKNKMTGSIPASLSRLMDRDFLINLSGNDFSGELPAEIVNHPRFGQLWDYIVPQGGNLAVPDIPAPVMDVTDVNGNHFSTTEVYKNNILTLLYNYSSAKSDYTDKLAKAYEAYKSKGFEVLGMIPGAEDVEEVMEYLYENNINWMNIDPKGFSGFYNRYFLYLNYVNLVDQNGHIVFSSLMDENGKMENTGWNGSTRDQLLFDVLEKKFGTIDYTPYTSTDYSADGEVMTLQKATKGLGVDIVFVGNAFTDKDMAPGGKYETKMKEAMEQFFVYEPLTSLRDRFNVYAVKAVSPNHELYEGTKQAISSNEEAFAYAQKVKDLIPDRPLRVNVIYDSYNAGRSITYMYDDASYVALMANGINRVLNHEGCGHGVGRLLDEYVEDNPNSVPTADEKAYLEEVWTQFGRGANIDLHADVTQTRWSHLAADSRYAGEKLGAYEGAGTYGRDVYRPTMNSMMRYNDTPFNAPSREAIYKYVMQESEGPEWVYDYETFVAFDEPGRQQFVDALQVAASRGETSQPSLTKLGEQVRPLPPVMVKGTWKDALNGRE